MDFITEVKNGITYTTRVDAEDLLAESLKFIPTENPYIPSDAELDEYVATQYSRDREAEYLKLNQDEMRFDDLENGTTTWQDAINAIKAEYPKPTGA